jgi:hypothetical protein
LFGDKIIRHFEQANGTLTTPVNESLIGSKKKHLIALFIDLIRCFYIHILCVLNSLKAIGNQMLFPGATVPGMHPQGDPLPGNLAFADRMEHWSGRFLLCVHTYLLLE